MKDQVFGFENLEYYFSLYNLGVGRIRRKTNRKREREKEKKEAKKKNPVQKLRLNVTHETFHPF